MAAPTASGTVVLDGFAYAVRPNLVNGVPCIELLAGSGDLHVVLRMSAEAWPEFQKKVADQSASLVTAGAADLAALPSLDDLIHGRPGG